MVQSGSIANPHIYLNLWLMCRKLQGDSTTRLFPDSGGALDQNYMVVWSWGVIDDAYYHELAAKATLEKNQVANEKLRRQLLSQRR